MPGTGVELVKACESDALRREGLDERAEEEAGSKREGSEGRPP